MSPVRFLVAPPFRSKHTCWCHSSVGRAKDWKSLCPRFDSWWHHRKGSWENQLPFFVRLDLTSESNALICKEFCCKKLLFFFIVLEWYITAFNAHLGCKYVLLCFCLTETGIFLCYFHKNIRKKHIKSIYCFYKTVILTLSSRYYWLCQVSTIAMRNRYICLC